MRLERGSCDFVVKTSHRSPTHDTSWQHLFKYSLHGVWGVDFKEVVCSAQSVCLFVCVWVGSRQRGGSRNLSSTLLGTVFCSFLHWHQFSRWEPRKLSFPQLLSRCSHYVLFVSPLRLTDIDKQLINVFFIINHHFRFERELKWDCMKHTIQWRFWSHWQIITL